MSNRTETIVETYRSLAQIPALTGAVIESEHIINTSWSQRDLERGLLARYRRLILINNDLERVHDSIPVDISTEILSKVSKSKKFKAVLRKNDSKQYLEIWKTDRLYRVVDFSALDVHGEVYADNEFGVFEFSPDESKLLYVAEKKKSKSALFYKRTPPEEVSSKAESDSKTSSKGEQFLFEQDWGEQLVGKRSSILAEYNIDNDAVVIVRGMPDNVCVAQPKYSPDGLYIIGVAYFIEPRKLGLMYCSNRPSTLFQIDVDGNYVDLALKGKSVKSPIFSPDGGTIVWLERESGGPHKTCMKLVKSSVPLNACVKSQTTVVVDIVSTSIQISNNRTFYGLYNTDFPKRPWISNKKLLVNTVQKYTFNSYIVDIDSGQITELEYEAGSQIVLDFKDNLILAVRRHFLVPDVLAIGKFSESDPVKYVQWKQITQQVEVPQIRGSIYKCMDLNASEGPVTQFNAIYLGPSDGVDRTVPLIIRPHGGPHSVFPNSYSLETALALALGYAVLLVNYRGSIGFGNDTINFLTGKIGTADVEDCIQAINAVLETYTFINSDQLALCGGSHGGFLVAHLSGQYPNRFKSVVARNPGIDIPSKAITSDIPDLSYTEAGIEFTQKGEITSDVLLKMRKQSPIMYAHKVKAPTLLHIGSNDLRVPPHQGKEYYFRLKANGVKVRMNFYEDNHNLGKIFHEMDHIINTFLWIDEHMV